MMIQKLWAMLFLDKSVQESYLMYYWLIAAFIFLIMEMGSPGLFFFMAFFFGCLIACAVSFLSFSIEMQIVSFFIGTVIALIVLRYCVMPYITKGNGHNKTNVYALKGGRGVVVKNISVNHPGLVRINGELWVAKVIHDQSVIEGDIVEVIDVRGAHVVVKKI